MKVRSIQYTDKFYARFKSLPVEVQKKAVKTIKIFQENPFHPSLRLHKLKGRLGADWSILVDQKYRIIFRPQEDGVYVFGNIGSHAIYQEYSR